MKWFFLSVNDWLWWLFAIIRLEIYTKTESPTWKFTTPLILAYPPRSRGDAKQKKWRKSSTSLTAARLALFPNKLEPNRQEALAKLKQPKREPRPHSLELKRENTILPHKSNDWTLSNKNWTDHWPSLKRFCTVTWMILPIKKLFVERVTWSSAQTEL